MDILNALGITSPADAPASAPAAQPAPAPVADPAPAPAPVAAPAFVPRASTQVAKGYGNSQHRKPANREDFNQIFRDASDAALACGDYASARAWRNIAGSDITRATSNPAHLAKKQ